MKYYIIHMHTGYAGMDAHDVLEMPDDATEDEIADEAYEMAVGHAEMYGIYPAGDYEGDDEIDEDSLSDNIEGHSIGEYNPELHDMYRSGGGSFQNDINRMR
jgi:hypothetical protein